MLHNTEDVSENNERTASHESIVDITKLRNSEMDLTDDDDVAQELRDDSSLRDEAEKGTPLPANNSILGDFSLLRDFFLAAFSDGCYKVCFKISAEEKRLFNSLNQRFVFIQCVTSGDLLRVRRPFSRRLHFTASS